MISLPRERMDQLVKRFDMLEARMSAGPAADVYVKLASEYSELQPVVMKIRDSREGAWPSSRIWNCCWKTRRSIREMRDMAEMELPERRGAHRDAGAAKSRSCCLPKDAADEKNAILEIRAGTGGDEAALFAGDLFRMYERYADLKGWKVEVAVGKPRRARRLQGNRRRRSPARACSRSLKFESGVHRVQRVPATEAQGRIHTSAATVAVLPEAEEVDIEIKRRGHPHRHDARVRRRRPARQHDRFGGAHHASADRHRGRRRTRSRSTRTAPRRMKSCARGSTTASASARDAERSRAAQGAGRLGRPLGTHPHLQFPAGPRHRPPHQPDALQARPGDRGRALDELIDALITETRRSLPRWSGRA